MLFGPLLRWRTIGGLVMAAVALITWWSCNAFIPVISSLLAGDLTHLPAGPELAQLKASFVKSGTSWFNFGGLLGTFLTIPAAIYLGRRPMYLLYFIASAMAIWFVFRLNLTPEARLFSMFFIGLSVFGIFGSFTFYLPELFPGPLRATGAGFCYNLGRFITAAGPFIVGEVAQCSQSGLEIQHIVSWIAVVPLLGAGLVALGLGRETKQKGGGGGDVETGSHEGVVPAASLFGSSAGAEDRVIVTLRVKHHTNLFASSAGAEDRHICIFR
jgi:MFS family permease